ncbi:class II aldolase/adducin family protein [Georgenia deserti]|uniref:Class II aldolase/adducin family protein n=1 Tax=Georgenia deserti TaxID=2093781 RepID=A0ABW4LB94_9MICO
MTAARADWEIADHLVAAGRAVVAAGLSPGSSGNISVRTGDRMLMSPTGARLDELRVDSLAIVDMAGEHIGGPRPSKEKWLHRAMYARTPEARGVVHVHSRHAVAASCLPAWHSCSALPPLTPYFVMRVGQTPLLPYAPPGDPGQAEELETLDIPCRAVLLQNHGSVVAGTNIASAVDAAVELEEAAWLRLALAGSGPRTLQQEEVLDLARRHGTPWTVDVDSERTDAM